MSRRWVIIALSLGLVSVGAVAGADRLRLRTYSDPGTPVETQGAHDGDSLPAAGDPQALAAAEAALVASQTPAARFARAAEARMPPALADATTRIDPSVLAALEGLVLVPWEQAPAPVSGPMRVEEMAYTDSSGLVLISFQDWPSGVDPAVLVSGDDLVITRAGYEIAIRDDKLTPSVTIFDGKIAVHVQAWGEPKLTTSKAEALAVAYYLALAG
jgi:hypothetical protein